MARFVAHNRMGGTQQAITTTFKTQINIVGAAAKRARLWKMDYGPEGSPNATDCGIVYEIATKDATTAGTSTALTVAKVNPADGAATLVVNANYTAEATTFTSFWVDSVNQRASGFFQAFDQDSAIVLPATANFGLGVRALSATNIGTVGISIMYEEM